MARGRINKRQFGKTLGSNEIEAASRLCHLITQIENGSFVRPSVVRKRMVSEQNVSRLSHRELVSEFLDATRKRKGQNTASTYRSRLRPVLDFAERHAHRKQWPFAEDINSAFAAELCSYLHQCSTTRNGHANGREKLLSSRQIRNILECLRAMCIWAQRATSGSCQPIGQTRSRRI